MTESASELRLMLGDCLERLREMEDCSVDSVVTDPPYGLSFMGRRWDYDVPSEDIWRECLRVLKPGGHLLAFAGTRTQHRMAVRIEDAGFEIRDMIAWVYGSGFPKSLDVSKAIDKAAGAEREVVGQYSAAKQKGSANWDGDDRTGGRGSGFGEVATITAPATEAARQWQGWGTALKPALEPITVARKPLGEKTVAANVLAHGTGGINVDGCRVEGILEGDPSRFQKTNGGEFVAKFDAAPVVRAEGRWPANLIHDGSEDVTDLLVEAARFFYCAKASKKDRDEGCDALGIKAVHRYGAEIGEGIDPNAPAHNRNHHPTVKPTALMRYLCRLVTPPEGIVLDPFMGSGSTGKAAMLEGFHFVGIERDPEYFEIATNRIAVATPRQLEMAT